MSVQESLAKLFDGSIKTSVAYSVGSGSPHDAVMIQLDSGIDLISDGQIYIFGQNVNYPFFQKINGESISDSIQVLKNKNVGIKSRIPIIDKNEIKSSKIVDSYYHVIDAIKDNVKSASQSVKLNCNSPLMLLNSITDIGPYEGDKKSLLYDLWTNLLTPIIDAALEIYSPDLICFFDPAIYDMIPFGPHNEDTIKAEIMLINEIGLYCEKKGIPLLFDTWRPLSELNPETRETLFNLEKIHVFALNYLLESDRKFIANLQDRYISLGIISNKPNVESVVTIRERINAAINKFGKENIMLSQEKHFLQIDAPRVRMKLTNMVKARDEIIGKDLIIS